MAPPLQGIQLKLLAYERFLEANPERAATVVLYQVAIAAPERPNDYHHTQARPYGLNGTRACFWARARTVSVAIFGRCS